jgi:hypothetical protein
MSTRQFYFQDLLEDCMNAVLNMEIPEDQQGVVIAALIHSDSYNGLRKAALQAITHRGESKVGDML